MEKTVDLRSRVQDYIDMADDRLLRLIEALTVSYQEEDEEEFELTDVQKRELDRRLQRYKEGNMKFYTWEEVEEKLYKLLRNTIATPALGKIA